MSENATKTEMIEALVRKELEWLVENPTEENLQDAIYFFANGGFNNYSDEDLQEQFEIMEDE